MKTINLQKNYNKLTASERFALLLAATARNDIADRAALLQSAPRKRWEVPTTYGLGYAWDTVSDWYIMQQLGSVAAFYYLIALDDEGDPAADILPQLQRNILTLHESFIAVCGDYGIDPKSIMQGLPYTEMIDLAIITIRAADQDRPPLDLPALPESIETMRNLIETLRTKWE